MTDGRIPERDLRVDTYTWGMRGDWAMRMTHLPTGRVLTDTSEASGLTSAAALTRMRRRMELAVAKDAANDGGA